MLLRKLLGVSFALSFATIFADAGIAATNALAISGTPASQVSVGQSYSFVPTITGAGPGYLYLRLSGSVPSWAAFDPNTGALSGTPTATGSYPDLKIVAWDGVGYAALRFSITVGSASSSASSTSAALVITGTPSGTGSIGQYYSFRPTVVAASGANLSYRVTAKPSWATFNTSTGLLAGTPSASNVATYSGIIIVVTDGRTTASLPAFNIVVSKSAAGIATLSWSQPTKNTDGSALTNLAGYHILYGPSSSALTRSVSINSATTTSASIENLTSGTWYFAMASINAAGAQSVLSSVISKSIL